MCVIHTYSVGKTSACKESGPFRTSLLQKHTLGLSSLSLPNASFQGGETLSST